MTMLSHGLLIPRMTRSILPLFTHYIQSLRYKNDIRKHPAQRLIDSVMLVKIGALGELEDKCEKGYRFSSFGNRKTVLFLWLESSLS